MKSSNTNTFIWTVFLVLVIPLVGYGIYSGLVVGEMELPGGFRFVFRERPNIGISGTVDNKLKSLSDSELEQKQENLEQRLRELEQNRNNYTKSSLPQKINLSGIWFGQGGLSYQINHSGNFLTIKEISPIYGITAVGQGQIQEKSVQISYQTTAYTQGFAQLTISSDGRSLNGLIKDNHSGFTRPLNLSR